MPKTADLPLAAQIIKSARELYEKHDGLAIALAQVGVVSPGTGQPYTDSQVSKWLKGQIEPPFEVILAAARLAHFSIDRYLYPEEAGSTDKEDRERLDRLEARHDRDIEELRQEFRKTLQAEMLSLRKSLRQLGQIGRGISTELDEDKRPT